MAAQAASRVTKWGNRLLAVILLRSVIAQPAPESTGSPPALPMAGPPSAAWREEALARASELDALAQWIARHGENDQRATKRFHDEIGARLAAVRRTAAGKEYPWLRRITEWVSIWRGASFNRTLSNLDSIEADLLRMAPQSYLRGELPSIQSHVARFLPKGDPRRDRVDLIATSEKVSDPEVERGALISAFHAANTQRRRDLLRVRDFRNLLYVVALTLIVPLVIFLGLLGWANPEALPLCFFPVEKEKVVCPTVEVHITAGDYPDAKLAAEGDPATIDLDLPIHRAAKPLDLFLIEVLGLIAAAVASAVALRNVRGSSTPFPLAVALSLVKVPLGALTAILGLLLMAGGFVPGLSALDSSQQILAWAVVFGYSQQLFTRFVDQRASILLDKVGGRGAAGDRAAST